MVNATSTAMALLLSVLLSATVRATESEDLIVRISSNETVSGFLKHVYNGLSTNTKFYIICLLSQREYLQYVYPVGYVLLGPSYARRNNCSGLLTIAHAPNPDGVTGITHTSPAKEERSDVLRLSCMLSEYETKTWISCGISLGLICFMYRTIMYIEERLPHANIVGNTSSSAENRVKSSRNLRMRTLLMVRLLLVFIIWHCFTGGYISFLNKPLMEEAPDTKERVLAFLRDGRLQFCMSKYAFVNGVVTHSNHSSVTMLRKLVHNWSQFKTTSPDTCLKRTRQREAVYFGSSIYLENYAASCEDEVQISRVFADDVMCPASIFLLKLRLIRNSWILRETPPLCHSFCALSEAILALTY
ncbi:hypothetical protein MTO96_052019 [Rhipicephalus appendiculatus]